MTKSRKKEIIYKLNALPLLKKKNVAAYVYMIKQGE